MTGAPSPGHAAGGGEGGAGPPLLLASTSPRRAALLAELGVAFEVADPGLDDAAKVGLAAAALALGLGPAQVVVRLAVAKALAAARRARPAQAVLAADTEVILDGAPLGKAADAAAARAALRRLRGRAHEVFTGLALLDARGRLTTGAERSVVRFAAFAEPALEGYVVSGAWRGKAGAYGVQDPEAAPLLAGVEGSLTNVVGLPLERVRTLLGPAGPAGGARDAPRRR